MGLYGQPADMEAICALAAEYGVFVIEDAAQSFGAVYMDKRSGGLGTIGCTSFYPAKPLGCFGEGGAICTNDDSFAAECRLIMNHGQSETYKHERVCPGREKTAFSLNSNVADQNLPKSRCWRGSPQAESHVRSSTLRPVRDCTQPHLPHPGAFFLGRGLACSG